MLSEVHNLLWLDLTLSVLSATSESFRVLTYLCSSMSEQKFNNCMLLHMYKELTDPCDMKKLPRVLMLLSLNEKIISVHLVL